jgi:hypothetical protein
MSEEPNNLEFMKLVIETTREQNVGMTEDEALGILVELVGTEIKQEKPS